MKIRLLRLVGAGFLIAVMAQVGFIWAAGDLFLVIYLAFLLVLLWTTFRGSSSWARLWRDLIRGAQARADNQLNTRLGFSKYLLIPLGSFVIFLSYLQVVSAQRFCATQVRSACFVDDVWGIWPLILTGVLILFVGMLFWAVEASNSRRKAVAKLAPLC